MLMFWRLLLLISIGSVHVLGFDGNRPMTTRGMRRSMKGIKWGEKCKQSGLIGDLTSSSSSRRVTTRLNDAAFAETAIQGITAAFIGGSTGVMGVMFALELQKVTVDKGAEGCPYCMGNGEILCGICRGGGRCSPTDERCNADGSCDLCDGRGLVQCINCKGDGRIVPIILQSKAQRDPEYSPDNVSLDAP